MADNGLEAVIHVGIDTVKLRGEGFVTYYTDGQAVKAGDLLLEFDLELFNDRSVFFLSQVDLGQKDQQS